jgi:hypothetical protein
MPGQVTIQLRAKATDEGEGGASANNLAGLNRLHAVLLQAGEAG